MSFHLFNKKHVNKKSEPIIKSIAPERIKTSSSQILNSNINDQSTKKPQDIQTRDTKPPEVYEAADSLGQPLDATTRDFMEERFGYDFSRVRVHTDEKARESAREVGASAYTAGRDVVFGTKQYDPRTSVGRHLLAHELTHVVQQARGGTSSQPDQRADAAADSILQGEAVSPTLLGGTSQLMQMKPDDPASKSAKDTPVSTVATGSWTTTLDRFGHNRSELTDDHRKSINALVNKIAAQVSPVGTRATIMINGHTDTSGDEK